MLVGCYRVPTPETHFGFAWIPLGPTRGTTHVRSSWESRQSWKAWMPCLGVNLNRKEAKHWWLPGAKHRNSVEANKQLGNFQPLEANKMEANKNTTAQLGDLQTKLVMFKNFWRQTNKQLGDNNWKPNKLCALETNNH